MLCEERVAAGWHGQAAGGGFAVPESVRRRHGRSELRAATTSSEDVGWGIRRCCDRGPGSPGDLGRGRTRGFTHLVQRNSGPSSGVIGHEQWRGPPSKLWSLAECRGGRADARGGQIPAVAALAAASARASPAWRTHAVCTHLALEPRPCGSQRVTGDLLIDVDRLGMLSQVIESRKASGAVALEGTLAGVFSDVTREMFAAGEAQVARREISAEEPLAFLLLRGRHGASLFRLMIGSFTLCVGLVMHQVVGGRRRSGVRRRRGSQRVLIIVPGLVRTGFLWVVGDRTVRWARLAVRIDTGSGRFIHRVFWGSRVVHGEKGGHVGDVRGGAG